MIELHKYNRARQSAVTIDGRDYRIKTDFFLWVAFGEKLKAPKLYHDDFLYLFDSPPPDDMQAGFKELSAFYLNEQPLPNKSGKKSTAISVDWLIDSEYIYAAFRQQYGINLITENLHWHDFLSLFNGLTGTKMNDIIGARNSEDKSMKTFKKAWSLNTIIGRKKYEQRQAAGDFKELK